MKEELKKQLLTIADTIRNKELDLLAQTNEILRLEEKVDKVTAVIKASILEALNENGKPLYSNAEKRELEFNNRLSSKTTIQKVNRKINKLQHTLDVDKIELKYLYNKQSNFKSLCRLSDTEDQMVNS